MLTRNKTEHVLTFICSLPSTKECRIKRSSQETRERTTMFPAEKLHTTDCIMRRSLKGLTSKSAIKLCNTTESVSPDVSDPPQTVQIKCYSLLTLCRPDPICNSCGCILMEFPVTDGCPAENLDRVKKHSGTLSCFSPCCSCRDGNSCFSLAWAKAEMSSAEDCLWRASSRNVQIVEESRGHLSSAKP